MFRKALAHRDSRHELLFTGIHLFMSRISWLILYRTAVCGVVHADHLIWGSNQFIFQVLVYLRKSWSKKAVRVLQLI